MIVNRRTFIVKKGGMQRVVELFMTVAERIEHELPFRIYTPQFGPFDVVVVEAEYEDVEAYYREQERMEMTDWNPVSFMEELDSLTEPGGSNELWTVETL
jgi:hypothetical protein